MKRTPVNHAYRPAKRSVKQLRRSAKAEIARLQKRINRLTELVNCPDGDLCRLCRPALLRLLRGKL